MELKVSEEIIEEDGYIPDEDNRIPIKIRCAKIGRIIKIYY